MVIWITGLSGAGKTTIAGELADQLRQTGRSCILLDGDKIRLALSDPHIGHDPESRLICAMRICRLAKMLEEEKVWVIVATMSLFPEVFSWNRKNFTEYTEVYVKVDFEILKQRDSKGLYSRAEKGEASNVAGVHFPVQDPENPDLILENNSPQINLSSFAQKILTHIEKKYPHP
jgi:cytidine diphosphoramidate kinase